jgi:hypothetical protein
MGPTLFTSSFFFREKENRVEQQPQEEDAQHAVRSLPLFVVSRL